MELVALHGSHKEKALWISCDLLHVLLACFGAFDAKPHLLSH